MQNFTNLFDLHDKYIIPRPFVRAKTPSLIGTATASSQKIRQFTEKELINTKVIAILNNIRQLLILKKEPFPQYTFRLSPLKVCSETYFPAPVCSQQKNVEWANKKVVEPRCSFGGEISIKGNVK